MSRCDNLWWIWSSFLSINFTLLILSWFLTSFFSRGTRSRFSTLAMNFVVMAYLSDKVRPILRLKLSCLSNKKNRASLDWIWIFGILILSDLGKLHCVMMRCLDQFQIDFPSRWGSYYANGTWKVLGNDFLFGCSIWAHSTIDRHID